MQHTRGGRPTAEELLRERDRRIEDRLADMELNARIHLAEIELFKAMLGFSGRPGMQPAAEA